MSDSRVLLFGTPTALHNGNAVQGLRHKSLALLAYLIVESRPLGRDTLATLLWPDSGQQRARANLRSCLWQLTECLEQASIAACAGNLAVDARQISSDIYDFQHLLSLSRREEDPARREQILESARKLCRGKFMEGFTLRDCPDFDTWELFHEELLCSQLGEVLSELASLKASRGAWNEALRIGRQLIELDPLDEESHRQMMLLLAGSGRRSEALRHYEQCTQIIAAELNEEPEEATVRLFERIKAGEYPYQSDSGASHLSKAAGAAASPLPQLLPKRTDSFVGRTHELSAIGYLVTGGTRLLTLTGPAGTGKTRLALQAACTLAAEFTGGIHFVDLALVQQPEDVPAALAAAVGLRETYPAEEDILRLLIQRFSGEPSLVLLDNFEHLLQAASIPAKLTAGAEHLVIIITSREALRVPGEHLIYVPPLDSAQPDMADSLHLFYDRAGAALRQGKTAQVPEEHVREICRLLDGLPLAIELAVPLLEVFTPQELVYRLRNPLDYLNTAETALYERHGSLQHAIGWSYRLLSEEEALLFSSLSVFTGSFTLQSVHRICPCGDDDRRTADILRSLIEKSLVTERASSRSGTRRFALLQTVRHYAAARAKECQLTDQLQERHAGYFAALVREQAELLHGPQEEQAVAIIDEEHADILSALSELLSNGCCEQGLRCAVQLSWYWYRRGRFDTGDTWLARFLEATADAPAWLRARGLRARGWMLFAGGEWRKAYTQYAEALYLSREANDAVCEARSLAGVGVVARWMGDVAGGTEYTEQAVQVARRTGDPALLVHTLIWAYATTGGEFLGEPPVDKLREAGTLARSIGNRWFYAHVLNGLGDLYSRLGSYQQAESNYLLSLREFRRLGDRLLIAWNEEGLGLLALRQGELTGAHSHTCRAAAIFHELGDELNLAVLLARLAEIHCQLGHPETAARCAGAASAVIDTLGTSDVARSPRIEDARRRCSEYEATVPLQWAEGRDMPRHEILREAGS
jgi:predicted ATPase/DNA-binding SARP family transcriptional activator